MGLFGRGKRERSTPQPSAGGEEVKWIMPKGLGWTVDDLYALEAQGEWGEALRRWKQLLAPFNDPVIADKIQDMPAHRHTWLHIGLCARHVGDYDESLQAYAKAQELARRAHDHHFEVNALTCIGIVHRNAGRHDQALTVLQDALAQARSVGDPSLSVNIHDNIGNCYAEQGRLEDALTQVTAAWDIIEANPSRVDPGLAHRVSGNLQILREALGRSASS